MIPAGLSCLHFLVPIFPLPILFSMWCSKVWEKKVNPQASSPHAHLVIWVLVLHCWWRPSLQANQQTSGPGQRVTVLCFMVYHVKMLIPSGKPLSGLGCFSCLTTFHVISLLLVRGAHSEWDQIISPPNIFGISIVLSWRQLRNDRH